MIALAALAGVGVVVVRGDGPDGGLDVPVERVVDGDTFTARVGQREERVRVIGVDTPEVSHDGVAAACYGEEARQFARSLLGGRRVRLLPGHEQRDRYGRLLARVEVGGLDLSRELARRGFARQLAIPPNTDDADQIAALVARARAAGTGLWAACGFAAAFPGR